MISLTPNAVKLVEYFDDGEETRRYQFRLLDPCTMTQADPGQFFMLTVPGSGSAAFTFTSSPDQRGQFSVLIRRTGSLTRALFECDSGSILGARGPFGKGWPIDKLKDQRVLIIAGGCGLAPLVSLTDYLLETKHCEQLVLLYGAATEKKQMLNSQRAHWQQTMPVYNVVEDINYNGLTGTPLDALPEALSEFTKKPTVVLLCGPEIMMQVLATEFTQRGLSPSSIFLSIERRMHCATGLCGHCYLQQQYVCQNGPTYRWDEFLSLQQNKESSSLELTL